MSDLRQRTLDVLVIDDSEEVRSVIAYCLRHLGHRIIPAATAGEAEACLEHQYFDLIVIERMISGIDTVEFIAEAKKRFPSTRILVMSGGGNAQLPSHRTELAAMMGAHETILKPFTAGEFLDVLGGLIPPSDTSVPFPRNMEAQIRSLVVGSERS